MIGVHVALAMASDIDAMIPAQDPAAIEHRLITTVSDKRDNSTASSLHVVCFNGLAIYCTSLILQTHALISGLVDCRRTQDQLVQLCGRVLEHSLSVLQAH